MEGGGDLRIGCAMSEKTSIRTFKSEYEALRQFVENSKAVGSKWNAQLVTINLHPDEGDFGTLLITDNGVGCSSDDLDQLINVGSSKSAGEEATSIYSFFGTGFYHSCHYLASNAHVLTFNEAAGEYAGLVFGSDHEQGRKDVAVKDRGETRLKAVFGRDKRLVTQRSSPGISNESMKVFGDLLAKLESPGLMVRLTMRQSRKLIIDHGRIHRTMNDTNDPQSLQDFLAHAFIPHKIQQRTFCKGLPTMKGGGFHVWCQGIKVKFEADNPFGKAATQQLCTVGSDHVLEFSIGDVKKSLPVTFGFARTVPNASAIETFKSFKGGKAFLHAHPPKILLYVNGRGYNLQQTKHLISPAFVEEFDKVATHTGSVYQFFSNLTGGFGFMPKHEFESVVKSLKRTSGEGSSPGLEKTALRYFFLGCASVLAINITSQDLAALNIDRPILTFDAGKENLECDNEEQLKSFHDSIFRLFFKCCTSDYMLPELKMYVRGQAVPAGAGAAGAGAGGAGAGNAGVGAGAGSGSGAGAGSEGIALQHNIARPKLDQVSVIDCGLEVSINFGLCGWCKGLVVAFKKGRGHSIFFEDKQLQYVDGLTNENQGEEWKLLGESVMTSGYCAPNATRAGGDGGGGGGGGSGPSGRGSGGGSSSQRKCAPPPDADKKLFAALKSIGYSAQLSKFKSLATVMQVFERPRVFFERLVAGEDFAKLQEEYTDKNGLPLPDYIFEDGEETTAAATAARPGKVDNAKQSGKRARDEPEEEAQPLNKPPSANKVGRKASESAPQPELEDEEHAGPLTVQQAKHLFASMMEEHLYAAGGPANDTAKREVKLEGAGSTMIKQEIKREAGLVSSARPCECIDLCDSDEDM